MSIVIIFITMHNNITIYLIVEYCCSPSFLNKNFKLI